MPNPSIESRSTPVRTDRRAQIRQKISSLTYVELGGGNGGIALNVSEGGMTVVAAQPLDSDGLIDIALQLPQTRKRLELKGAVRWLSDSHKEAGIRFVDLNAEQLEDIRGWMAREAAPPPIEDISAIPSIRAAMKPRESNFQFEDAEEAVDEGQQDTPDEPTTVVAKVEERPRVVKPEINISIPAYVAPPAAAPPAAAPKSKPAGPRKFERVYEEGHRVELPGPAVHNGDTPATDKLEARDEKTVKPFSQPMSQPPQVDARVVQRAGARTPFSTLNSDTTLASPRPSDDQEIVERVLETTAALSAASSAMRTPAAPLGLGLDSAGSLDSPWQTSSAALRPGDAILADDGSQDYRIHSQSGWVLGLLVLVLAAVSFVSGMAVRRGALNRVLGESDGASNAKSNVPGSSTAGAAAGAQAGGAAANAPAKPVDIEIVDSANRRWMIPAQAGGTLTPPAATAGTTISGTGAAASDTTVAVPGGADNAATSPAAASGEASNGTRTSSNVDLSDATTADAANGGFMITLPDTPISASSMVAISVRRFIPVPPDAAARNRNLQLGAVANPALPVYPADAMTQNIEGSVRLRATISADGNIQALDAESGPKTLMAASLTAVRNWRYNPTLLNGKPVETQAEITLVYRLPR